MDEDVKKEFAKLREEMQNQYEDALRTIEDDVASFKAKVSDDMKGHVEFTAEVVEKVEKNIVRGNEIILDEISDLEKKLVAKIEETKK